MKKYLSIMLLLVAVVFVSCGDDKDEPKPQVQTMNTAFLKGKAFQSSTGGTYVFQNNGKAVEFTVKEASKVLSLYLTFDSYEVTEENYYTYLNLKRTSSDGIVLTPKIKIYIKDLVTYKSIAMTTVVAGTEYETVYNYIGTADEVMNKYSSYTKDEI